MPFQAALAILNLTVIQPRVTKFTPLAEGKLRSRIESLTARLKFPLKRLDEVDGSKRQSHSNAEFYGLPWASQDNLNRVCCYSLFTEEKYCDFRQPDEAVRA